MRVCVVRVCVGVRAWRGARGVVRVGCARAWVRACVRGVCAVRVCVGVCKKCVKGLLRRMCGH